MSQQPGEPRGLSDDQRAMLMVWREGLATQDRRLGSKPLLKLAARAMVDEAFRRRLITDTESVLAELGPDVQEPDVTFVFAEQTPDTVTIVLPAVGGGLEGQAPELRERLRSRTSEGPILFNTRDDWDFGDVFPSDTNPVDMGDVGGLDGHPAKMLLA